MGTKTPNPTPEKGSIPAEVYSVLNQYRVEAGMERNDRFRVTQVAEMDDARLLSMRSVSSALLGQVEYLAQRLPGLERSRLLNAHAYLSALRIRQHQARERERSRMAWETYQTDEAVRRLEAGESIEDLRGLIAELTADVPPELHGLSIAEINQEAAAQGFRDNTTPSPSLRDMLRKRGANL